MSLSVTILRKMKPYKLIIDNPSYIPYWFNETFNRQFYLPLACVRSDTPVSDNTVLSGVFNGKRFTLISRNNHNTSIFFDINTTFRNILLTEPLNGGLNISSVLPENILKLPPRFTRSSVKKILNFYNEHLISKQKRPFPLWPYEESLTLLIYILVKLRVEVPFIRHDFPSKKGVVAITHDVDSEEGLKSISGVLDIERYLDIPATYFIVGNCFKKNIGILEMLVNTGNELGLHGYNHSGEWTVKGKKHFLDGWDEIKQIAEDMDVRGFRSPYLSRSRRGMKILEDFFCYDSSISDTSKLSPGLNIDGCASIYPYYITNNLIEIPITLPLDSSLIFLGFSPQKMVGLRKKKLYRILNQGGIAVLLTHTEKHFILKKENLIAYSRFLTDLKTDSTIRFQLMRDILKD